MISEPLVISCAVVGAELTRDIYPHLPLTPAEIADAAAEAVEAGATVIHLHVRDEEGRPTQRVDVFKDVTERIRAKCDCILQYSTGGAVGTPLNERYAPLSLQPEMATLSMGTMNFGEEIYENPVHTIETIGREIERNGILAELEIFDYGMMDTVERLQGKGTLPQKYHVDFVLGIAGGMAASIRNLVLLSERLLKEQSWSVAALGRHQLPMTTHAIAMGGHIRVGIEDNIYYRKGELAGSNAQFVKRSARLAQELGRPVATVGEARKVFDLS